MIAIPALDFDSIDVHLFQQNLLEAIAAFHEVDQPMQVRIVDFLITGHDTEVLLDLRRALRQPACSKFFKRDDDEGLRPVDARHGVQLLKLFQQPLTPYGYYHRLGQVCSQHPDLSHSPYASEPRLPLWFNDLVRFAATLVAGAYYEALDGELRCDCLPICDSLGDAESEQLLRVMLEPTAYESGHVIRALSMLNGFGKYLGQQLDRLMSLCTGDPSQREGLVVLVEHYNIKPGRHLPQIIDWGFDVSRGNRKRFQDFIRRYRVDAKPHLLQRLSEGTPTQRIHAAQWLDKLYGSTIADQLAAALAGEKDKNVYTHIDQLYSVYRQAREYESVLAQELALPPVEIQTGSIPLPPGFTVKFQAFLDEAFAHSRQLYRQALHSHALKGQMDDQPSIVRPTMPTSDDLLELCLYVEGKSTNKPAENPWLFRVLQDWPMEKWCKPHEIQLMQLMRLLDAVGGLQEQSSALVIYHFELLNAHRLAQPVAYGLREIDAAAEQLLGRPHLMSRGYLMDASRYPLEDNAIWPAYVSQLKLLEDSIAGVPLDQYDRDVTQRRQTALAIAGALPVLPKQLEAAAWSLVLADGWTLRPLARPLLAQQTNSLQLAIAALKHRSSGARMGAAELLQELKQPEAIEPLKQALRKEKLLPVQGQFLATLDSLGANVDEFIGREQLLEDALKADRRPTRSMAWFLLEEVPDVRWATDNQPIDRVVLEWWMLQCVRFESTTCSPIMRRALGMCRRDDTLRLAHFILDTWIKFDTDVPDRADLEQRVRAQAESLFKIFKRPEKSSPSSAIDVEAQVQRMIAAELRDIQRQQSAYPERGLLALVAAFGDGGCVEKMEATIHSYSGNRVPQAKALLEVVAQIDDPRSLRVLCSLAAGFRNASISRRAAELLGELSQRYGWTEDELAERMIPDAGFALTNSREAASAQATEMILSYGQRHFRATVNNQLEVVLLDEEGKTLRDLPAAKKEDEKAMVRAAKAQLKIARQVVQTTKEQLTERLFQAMCSSRSWTVKAWRQLLADHVLAGIACRGLIWSYESQPGAQAEHFQWHGDGSAIGAGGVFLQLADEGLIRVADPNQMPPAVEQYWMNHLAAQNIQPLFPQTRAFWSAKAQP